MGKILQEMEGVAIAREYQILVSGIKYRINVGWVEG
jgi:hypothetical protein